MQNLKGSLCVIVWNVKRHVSFPAHLHTSALFPVSVDISQSEHRLCENTFETNPKLVLIILFFIFACLSNEKQA